MVTVTILFPYYTLYFNLYPPMLMYLIYLARMVGKRKGREGGVGLVLVAVETPRLGSTLS